jgi:hypothetical protein
MQRIIIMASLLLLAAPQLALAGRVKVKETSTSSDYVADDGTAYSGKFVIDGKASTSWFEGEKGSGLGSWVMLKLPEVRTVSMIRIWGGYWFSEQEWSRANRPKEIELQFGEDKSEVVTLTDEKKMQEFIISSKPRTDSIRLKLKSVYAGTAWPDTAISEIQVFDDSEDKIAVVKTHKASSQLPLDADGNYNPENVSDGLVDSMWCEGSKDGNGEGEWLEFELAEAQKIQLLGLVNGIGGSIKYWMMGNRVSAATLSFDDGSTEAITVKNTMLPQMITFPARTTKKVKLTFDKVVQGKEYNDLCISEAYFK